MSDFLDPQDLEELVALRRDLHAHPELGFEEERTSAIVKTFLADCGIAVEDGIGKTGVTQNLAHGLTAGIEPVELAQDHGIGQRQELCAVGQAGGRRPFQGGGKIDIDVQIHGTRTERSQMAGLSVVTPVERGRAGRDHLDLHR